MTRNTLLIVAMLLLIIGFNGIVFASSVESKYDVTFYGKIKADLSLDDSQVVNGNYGQWVASEATAKDISAMNLTASETRLGLKFAGPDYEDMITNGLLEVDFFDTSVGQNKAEMYMRHAYVEVNWTDMDLSLLAGQTWDVVAPLNPTTLNYSVMWWQGNVQYRRPQVRVSKGIEMDNDMKLLFQLAAARNIGNAAATAAYSTVDTGVDNASPIWEGRVALTLPLLTEKKSTIGISAASGSQTEYTNAAKTTSTDYDVSLLALDFDLPLADKISLKTEFWSGTNVSTFLGGIGQGVNTTAGESIDATGYWLAFAFGPFEDFSFNVGYGVDDPDDVYLTTLTGKAKNEIMYANVLYNLNEAVKLGLELSNMETKYKDVETAADASRIQASVIYTF
ncbi:MAG: hypothetical protein V1747_08235 [Candidatus Omnitrophota bacterium]